MRPISAASAARHAVSERDLESPRPRRSVQAMFVGLVHDPGLDRPEPPEARSRPSMPQVPWRLLAWIVGWVWLLVLADAVGGFAGYLVVLLAVAVGAWRLDRWCARQYWSGLRDYNRVG
jgi:hypothetical protein